MTIFEKAVKVIAEDYRQDAKDYEVETCRELFEIWCYDTATLKEEFSYILREADIYCTDDCEVVDEDTVYSFRKLAMAVRRYKF